jgi:hypothetical protein
MALLVSDNRTFCLETNSPGPCSITVRIVLYNAQFNPSCPQSILSFSTRPAPITWQPPTLSLTSGGERFMTPSHSPNDLFPVGTTLVSYKDMQESLQVDDSRIQCSFNVGSIFVILLILHFIRTILLVLYFST